MTRKALCISFGAVLALALVVFAPAARADEWDQATQLTFNQPIEIPGNIILPAGTYWFAVPEGPAVSNIVHIYDVDRTQLLATLETIPTERLEATGGSNLTFAEQSQKQPITLLTWFYPGRLTGHEFVYPSTEEARLSESRQISVMVQPAPLVEAS